MCTQSSPDFMLQSAQSEDDRSCFQTRPAQSDDHDDSFFTVATAAVPKRSSEGSSLNNSACVGGGLEAAVQPGLHHPGDKCTEGASQPLPSLLRSLKKSRPAGQKAALNVASKPAPEQQQQHRQQQQHQQHQQHQQQQQQEQQQQHQQQQQQEQQQQQLGVPRVQQVAKAVEEAMRAGLLPVALGESYEGETLTMRILNNFQTQKSQAAEGENGPAKCAIASDVPTPTSSTCTNESPMKGDSSTDLDSVSSQCGEHGSRPYETWSHEEAAKEPVRSSRKKKAAARNKANQPNHGCALPQWLHCKSPEVDLPVELTAAQEQKPEQSPNRSPLSRDKLRARGRESLDAMDAVQGPQPLSLSNLRAKGHNVLAGVSKQVQQSTHEQAYAYPPPPPGLLPANFMPSPAMNAAYISGPISDSAQPVFMPPPGLSSPAQAGDTTCAYLLNAKRGQMPQSCAAMNHLKGPANEPANGVHRQFPHVIQQEDFASKEDVAYVDNVCNRLDENSPMVGSMGKPCTVEFSDQPLKVDLTSLQSIQW